MSLQGYTDSPATLFGLRRMAGFQDSPASLFGLGAAAGKKPLKFAVRKDLPPGWKGFALWLGETHPDIYAVARAKNPNAFESGGPLEGLGDDFSDSLSLTAQTGTPTNVISVPEVTTATSSSAGAPASSGGSLLDSFASSVKSIAQAVLPVVAQKQVMDVQLARAKAGLPPLDTSRYLADTGLNVGLTSSTQNTILMLGGLVVGGMLLFSLLGKSKRR